MSDTQGTDSKGNSGRFTKSTQVLKNARSTITEAAQAAKVRLVGDTKQSIKKTLPPIEILSLTKEELAKVKERVKFMQQLVHSVEISVKENKKFDGLDKALTFSITVTADVSHTEGFFNSDTFDAQTNIRSAIASANQFQGLEISLNDLLSFGFIFDGSEVTTVDSFDLDSFLRTAEIMKTDKVYNPAVHQATANEYIVNLLKQNYLDEEFKPKPTQLEEALFAAVKEGVLEPKEDWINLVDNTQLEVLNKGNHGDLIKTVIALSRVINRNRFFNNGSGKLARIVKSLQTYIDLLAKSEQDTDTSDAINKTLVDFCITIFELLTTEVESESLGAKTALGISYGDTKSRPDATALTGFLLTIMVYADKLLGHTDALPRSQMSSTSGIDWRNPSEVNVIDTINRASHMVAARLTLLANSYDTFDGTNFSQRNKTVISKLSETEKTFIKGIVGTLSANIKQAAPQENNGSVNNNESGSVASANYKKPSGSTGDKKQSKDEAEQEHDKKAAAELKQKFAKQLMSRSGTNTTHTGLSSGIGISADRMVPASELESTRKRLADQINHASNLTDKVEELEKTLAEEKAKYVELAKEHHNNLVSVKELKGKLSTSNAQVEELKAQVEVSRVGIDSANPGQNASGTFGTNAVCGSANSSDNENNDDIEANPSQQPTN